MMKSFITFIQSEHVDIDYRFRFIFFFGGVSPYQRAAWYEIRTDRLNNWTGSLKGFDKVKINLPIKVIL